MRLWAAATALREVLGAPVAPDDREEQERNIEAAREALKNEDGADAFAALWEAGRAMSPEDAVAYALATVEAS